MKDQRLPTIRKTLDKIVEALEATLRVERWSDADDIPEALRHTAGSLGACLDAANRVTSSTYRCTPKDTVRLNAMLEAMKRLDGAYAAYRRAMDSAAQTPADREAAAAELMDEIDIVKRGSAEWASA